MLSFRLAHGFRSKQFPSEALQPLTSLELLDFSNNQLEEVPAESFQLMENLRILQLQDNRIGHLSPELFKVMQNLAETKESNDSITKINGG